MDSHYPAATCLNALLVLVGSRCPASPRAHPSCAHVGPRAFGHIVPLPRMPSSFLRTNPNTPRLSQPYLLGAPLTTPAPMLPLLHLGLSAWCCFQELPVSIDGELTSILSPRA